MKKILLIIMALAIISIVNPCQGKTLNEFIAEAEEHQSSGRLDEAINTMEQAVKQYPDSSIAYTQLGVLISEQAQGLEDFSKIAQVIEQVFEMWDKAISLDPNNFTARFHRGTWAVSIPKFMGQLEKGISDMEFLVNMLSQSSDSDAQAHLLSACEFLAKGYQKQERYKEAKEFWQLIIDAAPEIEYASRAQVNVDNITKVEAWQAELDKNKKPDTREIIDLKQRIDKEPNNSTLLLALGKAYVDIKRYEDAKQILNKVIEVDSLNATAYKLLALVIGRIAGEEYDPRISLDTDFRTDLAFEVMRLTDKAVALASDDVDLRLMRGIVSIEMPFFVGRLDQGIEDLNMIVKSEAPDTIKAEALHWLGRAYQKKAMTNWIKVVSDYPTSSAARNVFERLDPGVKRIDLTLCKKPFVVIDFILGFIDELAPQTAVWIDDKDGNFIKNIYVSGFSGQAKDKQVNLPVWAHSSKFADVDGVTSASIDLGHHIYVWDLKDHTGKKVKSGEYIVKIEVAYWPSMLYQRVEAPIKLGKKDERVVIEEGDLIPYLEVKYYK